MMLAVAFSSELVLFRVIERVRLGAELAGHEGPDVARRLQDEAVKSEEQKLGAARRYLLRHARTAGEAGINVTTSQVVGSPVDAILDYCRDNDVDLVVMTTRGRSGLKRLILGSVAEAVVRSPVVPVLVISGAK
jgi:nucleotide-binding universal stress UspA family protein